MLGRNATGMSAAQASMEVAEGQADQWTVEDLLDQKLWADHFLELSFEMMK